jgi:hypothetical protein
MLFKEIIAFYNEDYTKCSITDCQSRRLIPLCLKGLKCILLLHPADRPRGLMLWPHIYAFCHFLKTAAEPGMFGCRANYNVCSTFLHSVKYETKL